MKLQIRLWILAMGVLLASLAAYHFHAAQSLEQRFYDFLFQARQIVSPAKNLKSNPIVLVTIDDESLEWIGSWPWPRSYHAKVIAQLNKQGAAFIGFDVVFDSPQSLGAQEDQKFSKALGLAKNVFLASMFNYRKDGQGRIESYRRPISLLLKNARGVGFTNPLPDSDGGIRRAQLITFHEKKRYPSLVLTLFKAYQKITGQVGIQKEKLTMGTISVPFDSEGAFKINYAGASGYFKRIPFNQVLDGSYFKRDPNAVTGKIVLIGATSPLLQDIFSNPFSRQKSMSGVEVQAHQLSTLITQKFIREFSEWINMLGLVFCSLVLFFMLWRLKAGLGLGLGLVWAALVGVIQLFLFIRFRIYIEAVPYFLLSLPVYFILISLWQYFIESDEKNFISRIFKKYMDSSVVDQVLKHPGSGLGDKREMTVLFCDLKGFTRFSETQVPEAVVRLLNTFLEKMTEIISRHGGTVDKYMGDSVMAFWGAPKLLEQHALQAVQAGFEMLQELKNMKFQKPQFMGFEISVGINTGPMIVGSMGSPKRLSYTVIGDAVNTAARLQTVDLPGRSDSHLIISDSTYRLVQKAVEVTDLGMLSLKGKSQSVQAYEVLSLKRQEIKK